MSLLRGIFCAGYPTFVFNGVGVVMVLVGQSFYPSFVFWRAPASLLHFLSAMSFFYARACGRFCFVLDHSGVLFTYSVP